MTDDESRSVHPSGGRPTEIQWVDPADVIPGSVVIVNVLWSPHPRANAGNTWGGPPDPPGDTHIGSWSVGSWMVPSPHDDHPARWSRRVQGIALLFQDVEDRLVVDTGQRTWAVPYGLANVVAVEKGTATYADADEDAMRAPCGAVSGDGRPCSVLGPHPSHRTAFPFSWWDNEDWREPQRRGTTTVADLARQIPPESPLPPNTEDITYEEG